MLRIWPRKMVPDHYKLMRHKILSEHLANGRYRRGRAQSPQGGEPLRSDLRDEGDGGEVPQLHEVQALHLEWGADLCVGLLAYFFRHGGAASAPSMRH